MRSDRAAVGGSVRLWFDWWKNATIFGASPSVRAESASMPAGMNRCEPATAGFGVRLRFREQGLRGGRSGKIPARSGNDSGTIR